MYRPKIVAGFISSVLLSITIISLALLAIAAAPASGEQDSGRSNSPTHSTAKQYWTNYVRIGAYGLSRHSAEEIVSNAQETGVFGIEVDNDIPGRYESFVNPEEKLQAIRAVAEKAHAVGNHAFVYIAGTECITAHADQTPHTVAKEHPDWLQRKITGEPAIFGGGTAFWIAKGDEDVWVSPYARPWREIYMQRVRQIAATGIDGIYVDIPYWMTHFEGWEDTWASFDDYTVAAFKKQTGLDAKKDLKLGDFSDPNFRKWVEFRIQTFTDFMHEIDQNAKSVNPQIKTIPEIYPGIEEEAVRVGADVYSLYPVVDAIAHEYSFGSGGHLSSARNPLDWFRYQVGMHSFRAFAEGKATWILNYSWDGDKKVDKREAMMNLAMSEVMAGANFWDAPGHSMAGSNDLATRTKIFSWIKQHEATFYEPRVPLDPVGVYFSPQTRNFHAGEFIPSYRGILILLMQAHREFQVVTPRTLGEFHGRTLILPDVREWSEPEKKLVEQYLKQGGRLIVTGEDAMHLSGEAGVTRFSDCPGKAYSALLERSFEHTTPETQASLLNALQSGRRVEITASPSVATSVAQVHGVTHVFLANFAGLVGGVNPVQTPQSGVEVSLPAVPGNAGYFLPFLGDVQRLQSAQKDGHEIFVLPAINKGGVFWYGAEK
ncbi:MAG TPA: hypothetical protein VIW68_10695 [Candidatus Sulfotelmatobacter sp.]